MAIMRFKRIYPAQAHNPQENLSRYNRAAVITSVNPESGTCVIRWLDNPGGRVSALMTQGSWGEYNMPVEGAVVLVQCDRHDQAHIIRYINLNQRSRRLLPDEGGSGTLPKIKDGEKYWESKGGAYLYMNNTGKITLVSPFDDVFEIDPDISKIRSKSVNWQVTTVAGSQTSGQVRRWVPASGTNEVITDGIPTINFTDGTPLTELAVSVNDKQGAGSPVFSMTIGTVVDADGNMVDKNDGTSVPVAQPTKQLAARISLASGVQIDIDKSGRVSITNARLNINAPSVDANDADIALGLETNNAQLGTRGQHAAREHDAVTIPLGTAYTDAEHLGLSDRGAINISRLVDIVEGVIATYRISGVTAGGSVLPLTQLTPYVPPTETELTGEITTGAPNMLVGDE